MKNNNLDLKTITQKIIPAWKFAKRYSQFLYFILLAILAGYLLWHINSLSRSEPSDDEVTSKLKTVQRPNVDQKALTQIQQLQDQNVDVQSLFLHARENPFSE
jgi:hypothetical protein